MKNTFKSYFSFSRTERIGIAGLLSLILLVFCVGLYLRYGVKPGINTEEEKLNLVWQKLQAAQQNELPETMDNGGNTALFAFDPNTLDSIGFIRLGLKAKTVKYLLNWRAKGKHFYKKEDLRPLYSLTEKEYQRLAPFISIAGKEYSSYYSKENLPPLPDHISLNTTDSATLVRLKGIGSFLAHKIVARRKSLGGFLKHEQLLEVYKFPDSTYAYLKEKLLINPAEIHKLNLNNTTEAQFAAHPYIGEKMAKNIVLLRSGLNKYEKTEQLRQVPLMNEEKYRKIAPYCTIE